MWDAVAGYECKAPLLAHTSRVLGLAWEPAGRRLASSGTDMAVRVCDPLSGGGAGSCRGGPLNQELPLPLHADAVASVAWAGPGPGPEGGQPGPALLASAGLDAVVRVWNTSDWTYRPLWHSVEVTSVSWSPGGQRLATCSLDGTVRVYGGAFASHTALQARC
ncbi:hypothetical protein GPECTOR_588g653 [Gonium pectorale]|uniref:Uncharacterized protein n=1 Tax=Gonium pectorale TaxID=33097 RepID=A0A150FUG7_GONPE|nr:hypothetical protein GPECTOR_588g653 [Gonium pectorale]|eukprot:KXZ41271.1 hypothetical protein GPECTOR_588g653 [Gonium pectorale]